ncbi:MAG: deoxyribodipyrimidine photo-lyase [Longimonas sp.]|uniref:cryptochrome/photolyase family protein n=1 Tax=Longimonas sp. TaxID=2039626 RepID=UPI00334875F3
MSDVSLVWLRHDLRLRDNPALHAAARHGAVVPVFVWDPDGEAPWQPGGAHRWWLHESLQSLQSDLQEAGSRLILRTGPAKDALLDCAQAVGATHLHWNRRYEPTLAAQANEVATALKDAGCRSVSHETQLLHDPEGVETTSGGPYHVYTPFWNKVTGHDLLRTDAPPLGAPDLSNTAPDAWPDSASVQELRLHPKEHDGVDWTGGLSEVWTPGEAAAHERLQYTLDHVIADYETERDRPDHDGTSRLSPYLHHGELSPLQVWHAVTDWADANDAHEEAEPYLQELVWREFAYHMVHHYPTIPDETYRDKFKDFAWTDDEEALQRWQHGQTGYPIVDAGMRQLYETGWMHNRVRMIVGSFLTKDLLIHWYHGERWFWEHLVDGNLANNSMGWQWSAGSGADAQPFFRIFNPVSQGERHDPNGDYVREWIPELRDLPTSDLHAPWEASARTLRKAGVTLGETYPKPIVDHSAARDAAMEAYDEVR